jgi:hypothetical protein
LLPANIGYVVEPWTAGFPFWRYQPFFSVADQFAPDLSVVDTEDLGRDFLRHLRTFGDYLKHPNFHQPLPLEHNEEGMFLTGPPYIVFSDDVGWCWTYLHGAWLADRRATYPRCWCSPDLGHIDPIVMIPPGAMMLEEVKLANLKADCS